MKFTLDTTLATALETDCLVIGVFEDIPLQGSAELVDKASDGALQQLINSGDVGTDWKETTLLHGLKGVAAKRILVLGCGEAEKFNNVRYDRVCSSAGTFLNDHATTSAHFCLHEIDVTHTTDYWRLRQAAVNLEKTNYRYTATKAPKDDDKQPLSSVSFNADAHMQAALKEASGYCQRLLALNRTRQPASQYLQSCLPGRDCTGDCKQLRKCQSGNPR